MIKNIDFLFMIDKANKELKIVYDYIKSFKENQVEQFNDFVTVNEL